MDGLAPTPVRLVDSTTLFPLTVSTVRMAATGTVNIPPLTVVKLFGADPLRSSVFMCSTFTDLGLRLGPTEIEARELTTSWPFTGNAGLFEHGFLGSLWAYNPSLTVVEQVTFVLEQWAH